MAERKKISSERSPQGVVDTYVSDKVETMYSDGFNGVTVGPSVSRIELFRVVETKREGTGILEDREITINIVVPTQSFVDFVASVLPQVIKNQTILEDSVRQTGERLSKMVVDLKAS